MFTNINERVIKAVGGDLGYWLFMLATFIFMYAIGWMSLTMALLAFGGVVLIEAFFNT